MGDEDDQATDATTEEWSEWAGDGIRAVGDALGAVPVVGDAFEAAVDAVAEGVEYVGHALEDSSYLRRGSSGDGVRRLQEYLAQLGFDPGGADGDFGPRTEQAVCDYQGACGLTTDGIVGPITWEWITTAISSIVETVSAFVDQVTEMFEQEPISIPGVEPDRYDDIQGLIAGIARDRLNLHGDHVEQALSRFHDYAEELVKDLEDDSDFDILGLFVAVGGILATVFVPSAAVAAIASAAMAVGGAEMSRKLEAAAGASRRRLRHAATDIEQHVSETFSEQQKEAIRRLDQDIHQFFSSPREGDFSKATAQKWVCDELGIPDPVDHSCYSTIVDTLTAEFASEVARVKAAQEYHLSALEQQLAYWRGKLNDLPPARAGDEAGEVRKMEALEEAQSQVRYYEQRLEEARAAVTALASDGARQGAAMREERSRGPQ